jgi:hypothetical protein
MSLQKMISDVETERAHNRAMGDSLSDQLRDIKFRFGEEIDALIAALQIEVEARDQALAILVNGNA